MGTDSTSLNFAEGGSPVSKTISLLNMENLLEYLLLDDRDGHTPPQELLNRDITIEEFRQILLNRTDTNIELFMRQWFRYHPENNEVAEMWYLFNMKGWHHHWYIAHLPKYDKYRMTAKDGF